MADGRHLEKSLNRQNLATVPSIFTKFDKTTPFRRLYPDERNNCDSLKIKMADDRHFEKPLNRYNSATVRLIAMKFGMNTHFDPPKPGDGQKYDLYKPRWQTADGGTRPRSVCSKRISDVQNRYDVDADRGACWRHLANTIEPSVCGGDSALCQITLTTC